MCFRDSQLFQWSVIGCHKEIQTSISDTCIGLIGVRGQGCPTGFLDDVVALVRLRIFDFRDLDRVLWVRLSELNADRRECRNGGFASGGGRHFVGGAGGCQKTSRETDNHSKSSTEGDSPRHGFCPFVLCILGHNVLLNRRTDDPCFCFHPSTIPYELHTLRGLILDHFFHKHTFNSSYWTRI